MTSIVFAPRRAKLDGTEPILTDASYMLRPARDYVDSGGQAVKSIWSEPFYINGVAVTKDLDPLPNGIPWEARLEAPDGLQGTFVRQETRVVPSSGSNLLWESLTPVTLGGGAIPASVIETRLAAVETALANASVGGATTLAGITDMSAFMRTVNDDTTAAAARSTLGAGTSSLVIGTTSGTAADGALAATKANPTLTGTTTVADLVATGSVTVPDGSLTIADINGLQAALDAKSGVANLPISAVNGLQSALDTLTTSTAAAYALADSALQQEDLAPALSSTLSNYVTNIVLNGLLANIVYTLPYGSGWPSARPAAAGTRAVWAYGGPAAPSWLSTTYKDVWLGTS